MQDSNTPVKIPLPFASGAGAPYINSIPLASQIGITNGAASFTDGFPPLTFVPIASGGAGPFGKDFNGLLNQMTAGIQWQQAGGPIFYDGTFVGQIGGYPKGAILASATTLGAFWLNLVDNNSSNPDTGGANWQGLAIAQAPTTATTFYCNYSTGSDATGIGSSGNPWKTLQHAWDVLFATLNGNNQTITIDQQGTDPAGLTATGAITGVQTLNIVLHGSLGDMVIASGGARLDLSGTTGVIAGGNWGVIAQSGGFIRFRDITIGACTQAKVSAAQDANIVINGDYIDGAGGSVSHWEATSGGVITVFPAITVTQNGAAYTQFALGLLNGTIKADLATFAGTPSTGLQYNISSGAGFYLNGVTPPGAGTSVDAATYGWVVL